MYNQFISDGNWQEFAGKALSSLFYQNKARRLPPATSRDLYGEQIHASVSRMELFYSCPFSHFAKHGLQLKERQIFRLDAPDIGELFHGALKYIAEKIMAGNRSWKDLKQIRN